MAIAHDSTGATRGAYGRTVKTSGLLRITLIDVVRSVICQFFTMCMAGTKIMTNFMANTTRYK